MANPKTQNFDLAAILVAQNEALKTLFILLKDIGGVSDERVLHEIDLIVNRLMALEDPQRGRDAAEYITHALRTPISEAFQRAAAAASKGSGSAH